MKLGNLERAKSLLVEMAEVKTNFKTARKMLKVFKWIDEKENLPFFLEQKNEIVTKYATKDENGNTLLNDKGELKFTEKNLKEAEKEYAELFTTEVEIPSELKFTEQELSSFNFTLEDIAILEEFIED